MMKNQDIELILSSDPVEAIEAAKRISGEADSSDALATIAMDRTKNEWSRIAAIYALGSINTPTSGAALVSVLGDHADAVQCRAHAAEALAHVSHPQAVPIMEIIATSNDESPEVRRWCIYSLSEIGGRHVRQILEGLAQTKPAGEIGRELQAALRRLH